MDESTLSVLLKRAYAEDKEALAEIYREFHPRVFGLCRYLLGSREEAEDAASDIFTRLPRAMKTYDSALPFSRWLLSVTSHHCVDLLRKKRAGQLLFEPAEDEGLERAAAEPSPLQELLSREEREKVRAAITELPEAHRAPLVLHYDSELSYDEIASVLGLSRANVATSIFRAKKKLRQVIEKRRQEKLR